MILLENMKTFIELFNTILTADEETSRQAAREIRKLVYSSRDGGKYKDIASIIENAPAEYIKITEDWRQENFVMAISVMYFLHNRENQPDFLFPWLFQLLQHKNGNIRHATVRMIQNELGPLTYYVRFPGKKSSFHKFSSEQAGNILTGLCANLNNLAENSWKDSYKKIKYIDKLPSGIYKSVQLILSCLEDYCIDITSPMEIESKEEILAHRKELEQELVDMLKETDPTSPRLRRGKEQFTLQDVKDAIYNEEDNDDMMKVVAMFDCGGDASELSYVLELVTDAWNYFPHEVLGGISPAEKLLEHQSQSPLYECPECKLGYREKKWAKACEAWCKEHHSCNLEITAHAEK